MGGARRLHVRRQISSRARPHQKRTAYSELRPKDTPPSRLAQRDWNIVVRAPPAVYASVVLVYALVEFGDDETIDLFLRREAAFAPLADCVRDEPGWSGLLYVAPIEFDERDVCLN